MTTICRVYGCQSEAMTDLCGKHDEDREDGVKLRMKAGGRGRPGNPPKNGYRYVQTTKRPGFRQCTSLNKYGEPCPNSARPGSEVCGCHTPKEAKP